MREKESGNAFPFPIVKNIAYFFASNLCTGTLNNL